MAGIAIAVAAGGYAPWYPLVELLPGYASLRIPSKHLVLAALALALAAGVGFERLRGWRAALVALVVCAAVVGLRLTMERWVPVLASVVGGAELISGQAKRQLSDADLTPVLAGMGVLVVVAVAALIIFIVGSGGDDNEPTASTQTPSATATATPTAAANRNDIVLQATDGSQAAGIMRLIPGNGGKVQFALAAQNVPANKNREVYAVWFTRDGGKPIRLGFAQAQVGKDGVLTTAGPQKGDEKKFPRWFATYDKVLVTRETSATAKQPGPPVLEGTLPSGA
jgi:hypothetical protein